MTTEAQQVDGRRVEVRQVTTAAQYREALRGQMKVSPAARRQRMFFVVLALVMAALAVHPTPDGVGVDPVGMSLAAVWLLLGTFALRWLTARAQQRAHGHHGERRIVVDETGVSVETAHTFTRFAWPAMSRYVETRHLFVLASADKRASCVVFLPRQGVGGTDESERLRALFDAHLPRG
ncbi:YcxB family protein [Streptomyces actuosus]|uniref:YcxB family protein n=1 Tax=Streptomyces actuosus TaxID=1885 RepID=A0ABS2VM59_STRAS|nr:YcxB family protein [Streptomyces actuosus]MBN0044199.1 YcxB family protein [Streptomyces actuosus]